MATTTNYGWTTPDDTALVKDGAAAIRTLGSSVDSTLKTQIDNTVAAAIPKTIVDAKGDLIAATAADTVARLAVGSNDQVLIADSTTATGLKWGTVAAGGMTQLASGNLSGSTVNLTSISQSYKNLVLVLRQVQTAAGQITNLRLNNVSTALYNETRLRSNSTTVSNTSSQTSWPVYDSDGGNPTAATQIFNIQNYTNAGHPSTQTSWDGNTNGRASFGIIGSSQGGLDGAITQINIFTAGTWSAGNYILFGVS